MKREQFKNYLFFTTFLLVISFVFVGKMNASDASDDAPQAKNVKAPPVPMVLEKMTLGSTDNPRFTLTDIVWPDEVGEASVCLWNNDKIAAVTLTIDDNQLAEQDWWLSMQTNYPELKFTWFLYRTSNFNDWNKFQALIDSGNEVQAHDYYGSNHCKINDSSDVAYHNAALLLKNQIDSNLVNNTCVSFAYPCGINRSDAIDDVFISVRGVYGIMNKVNEVNYLDVNSRSAKRPDIIEGWTSDDIDILLDSTNKLWNEVYYRGWASYHFHNLNNSSEGDMRPATQTFLGALHDNKDALWVGGFGEVSKYGQERDSHTLTVTEVSDTSVKFTLSDEMIDKYFDFPLTVKVRIPNNWTEISVKQDTNNVESEIVINDIKKYVLVKAVPDKGIVSINATDTIDVKVTGISVSSKNIDLETGDTLVLTGTISPANADEKYIQWSTLNSAVATVDENGVVKAVGEGSAQIVVKTFDGGLTDTCSVSVSISETKVNINLHSLVLSSGETFKLSATVSPSNATYKTVTWLSDNEAVATVDQTGLVTAVADGSANIIVTTDNKGFTDTSVVRVGATGINELNYNKQYVNIYPNPSAVGSVTIEMQGYYTKLETLLKIFDITGKTVYEKQLTNTKTQFDISEFKKGIYFITITNETDILQSKLVVQ